MEVNARLWQWHSLASDCGVDLVEIAYRDALGLPVPGATSERAGQRRWVALVRHLRESRRDRLGLRKTLAPLRPPFSEPVLSPDVLAAGNQATSYLSIDKKTTELLSDFYAKNPDLKALNDLAPQLVPPPTWPGTRGSEIPQVTEWFAKFGDKLPGVLWAELDALKARLGVE